MKKIVQFTTNDGNALYVEVADAAPTESTRGGAGETRGVIENAKESFEKVLTPLKEVSNSIIDCIKSISNSPSEVEVELGLKFTAKAGIVITSLDSEAHFRIVFKWTHEKPGNK